MFVGALVIIFTTPPIAPSPYITAPAPWRTSIFEISSTGTEFKLNPASPLTGIPSNKITVLNCAVAPEPLKSIVGEEPSISLTTTPGTPLSASAIVFAPFSLISFAFTTVIFLVVSRTEVPKLSEVTTVCLSSKTGVSSAKALTLPNTIKANNINFFFILPPLKYVIFFV